MSQACGWAAAEAIKVIWLVIAMIEAVIFDMDGLVLDTDRIFIYAADRVGEKMGIGPAGSIMAAKNVGRSEEYGIVNLKRTFGASVNIKEFYTRFLEVMEGSHKSGPAPVKPGVMTLVKHLKAKGITTVLANFNSQGYSKQYLKLANLENVFDYELFGDSDGFSDSDMYETVCLKLNLTPSNVVALDDAPYGAERALETGLITIMVPGVNKPDGGLKGRAYACVDSLFDVVGLINKLISIEPIL